MRLVSCLCNAEPFLFKYFEALYHACMINYPLYSKRSNITIVSTNCSFRIYDVLHNVFNEMSFRLVKAGFTIFDKLVVVFLYFCDSLSLKEREQV